MTLKKKKKNPKSHYHLLKGEWLKRHKKARKQLHEKHKEALEFIVDKFPAKDKLASGAIGALMLSSVIPSPPVMGTIAEKPQEPLVEEVAIDRTREMLSEVRTVVPDAARPLNSSEEATVSEILSRYFKTSVKPDINGLRLNRSYGIIGSEQHLVRYPGDLMATHLAAEVRNDKMFYSSGMAPGRGAWGYFAKSKADFNEVDIDREKWYIAVQTFAAPAYNQRLSEYRDFFKYRKMLVVNTETGQAIVCDIGDAGPALSTGKHLGGSPEVMYFLGFGKSRKGAVLYFFVDDADNKIPLGPITAR